MFKRLATLLLCVLLAVPVGLAFMSGNGSEPLNEQEISVDLGESSNEPADAEDDSPEQPDGEQPPEVGRLVRAGEVV